MSVMTHLLHRKIQRFKVTYQGRHHYANAATMDTALAIVRTRLIAAQKGIASDPGLATMDTFRAAAGVMPSLRY